MNDDEAGRLQEKWNAKHGDKPCNHGRMVDYLIAQNGLSTGKLVCRECGTIYADPLQSLPDSSPPLTKL